MPIYEYTCQDCHTCFEKFVRSMTANIEVKCPECGGSRVKKGWSLFGTGLSGTDPAGASAGACNTGRT